MDSSDAWFSSGFFKPDNGSYRSINVDNVLTSEQLLTLEGRSSTIELVRHNVRTLH
jgi:hypothetical protein